MDAVINFFKEFSSMLPTIKVMDIVDILVVAFLIYKVIMMVRSTSAARIAKSVLIILILAGVTQLLNMYLLNYILDKILEIGLVFSHKLTNLTLCPNFSSPFFHIMA